MKKNETVKKNQQQAAASNMEEPAEPGDRKKISFYIPTLNYHAAVAQYLCWRREETRKETKQSSVFVKKNHFKFFHHARKGQIHSGMLLVVFAVNESQKRRTRSPYHRRGAGVQHQFLQGSHRDRFFILGPGTAVTISHGNSRDFLDGNWPSRYHRDGNKT